MQPGPAAHRATLGHVDKVELRRTRRAERRARRTSGDGQGLAAGLADLLQRLALSPGLTLAGYIALSHEPDVGPCLAWSWSRGDRVVVPRTMPDCGLEWLLWAPDVALVPDRHGLLAPVGEPAAEALALGPTVMLVPALAVDGTGTRLGNGAGYYDRALAALPRWPVGPLRVAVVHPGEVMAEPIPAEPHDEPVDAILTAESWRRV